MKSITYILITVFICGIFITALPGTISNRKQVVKIQTVNENPDSALLYESCLIIKNRLKDYGLQNFDISLNSNQKIIAISINGKIDINKILPLLISKGKIEFYETINRTDFIKLLAKGDTLFSLLSIAPENAEIGISSAILGTCKPGVKSQVDSYIDQHYNSKPRVGIKFIWSKNVNKDGDYYLYLLKPRAVLSNQQIMKASVKKINGGNDLMITFNEKGGLIWQNLSKNNMNKPIAIVIDNKVYAAPVIKEEINNSRKQIVQRYKDKRRA